MPRVNDVTAHPDGYRSTSEWLSTGSFWLRAGVLALVVLLAYSSVFNAGFIWDDDAYVTNNPHLETLTGLFRIWFSPGATPQYYPMVFTVFWVEYHLWGLNPAGYHLVNITLHILNALLLWGVLRRFRISGSFWAACLFALHPVHVESVAWITELKNVLSLFFYLLALPAYFRYLELAEERNGLRWRAKWWYLGALILLILALLSKTVTASLPAVILLLLWWRDGKVARRDMVRLVPFFAVALFMGLVTARLEVTHVMATGAEWDFSFIERVLIAGRAVCFYASKLIWPNPLIFSYPRWDIDAGQWWQYLYPSAVFAVVWGGWRFRGKIGRGPLAALLFFIGTLFPALGFFNVYPMRFSFVADHFQYAASIGPIVLFCAAVDRFRVGDASACRFSRTVVNWIIPGVFCLLVWQQGKIYQNSTVLFSEVIARNPASWMSYSNRGFEYYTAGLFDLALADFQQSLELKPDNADALNNRGMLYQMRREYDKALADFSRAIELSPWQLDFYLNRSLFYLKIGRLDLAVADCSTALQRDGSYVKGYLQRAMAYGMLGKNAEALADLSSAVQLDPVNVEAYTNRGLIYYRQGRADLAIMDFDKALAIRPDSATTHFNRGLAQMVLGEPALARESLLLANRFGYALTATEIDSILAGKK